MPRPLRIAYPGALYHVMNRGNARQPIFRAPDNYKAFLSLLQESAEKWNIVIHAFSLMPNHYHLLIETPLGNLSRAMRHINGVYTQRYNRRWKRDGHLLRGRYKAILVEDDAYLVELMRYIHLNPVMGGIVKTPEDHLWTSHKSYLGENVHSWLTIDRLLGYFGRRRSLARRKLHQFVMEGVPERLRSCLDGSKWPGTLSSAHFEEWVQWNFVKDLDDGDVEYVAADTHGSISEKKVKDIVCRVLDVKWAELSAPTGRDVRHRRMLAIRCMRRHLHWTYGDISKNFGGIHASSISRCVNAHQKIEGPLWEQLEEEVQNAKRKT